MTVRDPLGAAVAWLAHPFSVLGLALLLLNDHLLKQVWPGVVTGKLSDLAGLLMFPPLLAALMALALPRARAKTLAVVALCLTGCGSALSVVSGPSIVRAEAEAAS